MTGEVSSVDPAEVQTTETPRFIQAVEKVNDYFGVISSQHAELSRVAQDFDFIIGTDSLVSTRPLAAARFRQVLDESEAPDEIVAIYADIYDELINEELDKGK